VWERTNGYLFFAHDQTAAQEFFTLQDFLSAHPVGARISEESITFLSQLFSGLIFLLVI